MWMHILLDVGHCGLGLVLRRDDGCCVGAATRVWACSYNVVLAETLGLSEALSWIEKLKISNIIFELDAATIVKYVKTRHMSITQWGSIAQSLNPNHPSLGSRGREHNGSRSQTEIGYPITLFVLIAISKKDMDGVT
jgi:ribonuclease HI